MVRLRITDNVDSHHTNPEYKCLVVEFIKGEDDNYRHRFNKDGVAFDWLPKDDEIMDICRTMYEISPTFRLRLKGMMGIIPDIKDVLLEDWY